MKKIERIFEVRGTNRKKTELKYQLQNECVMSMAFVLYTFILSILAMEYAINTEKHLHEEVSKYFFSDSDNLGLRLIYSLSFVPLIQDGVIMVSMILFILLPWMVIGKGDYSNCKIICKKSKQIWWKFCAYSSFFPLACLINHLNYIIIAFTFNLYHATSIALIYGGVGIFIYVVLDRLPYVYSLQNNNEYWISLFITKALAVVILGLYVVFDGVIYYLVPIDISFDIAGNNFLSIYNTVVVFLTTLVAYVFIKRSYQSPISIFSKARDKIENDKEVVQDDIAWEDMTEEEKDIDSAIQLWENMIPKTTIPTTTTPTLAKDCNSPTTTTSDSDPAITPSSATDFKDLGAPNDNIKMVRMYEVILYFYSDL